MRQLASVRVVFFCFRVYGTICNNCVESLLPVNTAVILLGTQTHGKGFKQFSVTTFFGGLFVAAVMYIVSQAM